MPKKVDMNFVLPVKLWYDNKTALHITFNSVYRKQTKYIKIDYYFIREKFKKI